MKLISKKSRYLPIALLMLLLISVLLAFSKAYNITVISGQNLSVWFAVYLFLSFVLGLILYFLVNLERDAVARLNEEVKLLKQSLDTALKTEVKEASSDEKEAKIDIDQTISLIIPRGNADDMEKYGELLLANVAKQCEIVQGLYYQKNSETGQYSFTAGYAYFSETQPISYTEGETLSGQVAKNRQVLNLDKVPDGYLTILSGLGKGSPRHLLIVPVISPRDETIGIIELASFKPFGSEHEKLFSALGRKLGELLVSNKSIS